MLSCISFISDLEKRENAAQQEKETDIDAAEKLAAEVHKNYSRKIILLYIYISLTVRLEYNIISVFIVTINPFKVTVKMTKEQNY